MAHRSIEDILNHIGESTETRWKTNEDFLVIRNLNEDSAAIALDKAQVRELIVALNGVYIHMNQIGEDEKKLAEIVRNNKSKDNDQESNQIVF